LSSRLVGQFEYVDGVRVNGVAIRNQSGQWSGLQDSDSNVIGVGDGNRILVSTAYGIKDDLLVGGWFTKTGGKSIEGATLWDDGAQTFNPLGLFFFFFLVDPLFGFFCHVFVLGVQKRIVKFCFPFCPLNPGTHKTVNNLWKPSKLCWIVGMTLRHHGQREWSNYLKTIGGIVC